MDDNNSPAHRFYREFVKSEGQALKQASNPATLQPRVFTTKTTVGILSADIFRLLGIRNGWSVCVGGGFAALST